MRCVQYLNLLHNILRTCDQIAGVQIRINNEPRPLKITLLTDDTTLFVSNETDIVNALSVVDKFSEVSGLYQKKKKTEGLWLNNLVNAIIGGIKWSKQIKALGFSFGMDKSKCENLNWQTKIVQCKNLIDIWNKRQLTIYGQIVGIKSILLPTFTYLIQSCVVTKHVTNQSI